MPPIWHFCPLGPALPSWSSVHDSPGQSLRYGVIPAVSAAAVELGGADETGAVRCSAETCVGPTVDDWPVFDVRTSPRTSRGTRTITVARIRIPRGRVIG